MSKSYKSKVRRMTVEDAVSVAYSTLQELRDELREIVDNASEGLSQTQRIQTLGETADVLDNVADDEPELPASIGHGEIDVHELVHVNKRASLSRNVRNANAASALQATIDDCERVLDTFDDERNETDAAEYDAIESLRDHLQQTLDEIESLEFPGMFG